MPLIGVLSGVYVFKPLFENNSVLQKSVPGMHCADVTECSEPCLDSTDRVATGDKTAASTYPKPSDGPGSTLTASNTNAGPNTN